MLNDEDSSAYGYWAIDNFTRTIHLWQTGLMSFAINVSDAGHSYIPAGGLSPGNKVTEPYNGNAVMMGEQNLTLNGTYSPTLTVSTTNALIGKVNFGGSNDFECN